MLEIYPEDLARVVAIMEREAAMFYGGLQERLIREGEFRVVIPKQLELERLSVGEEKEGVYDDSIVVIVALDQYSRPVMKFNDPSVKRCKC